MFTGGDLVLASDEREAGSEFAEEMGEASDQCIFEFAFAVSGVEVEEIEVVWVLENAVGQV